VILVDTSVWIDHLRIGDPQLTGAWAVLAACGVLGQLGPILQLPDKVLRISPFANVPALPRAPLEIMPLAVLSLVAIALTAAGIWGFQRRDIG